MKTHQKGNTYICVCVLLVYLKIVLLQIECTCHLLHGPSNVFDVCSEKNFLSTHQRHLGVHRADDMCISDRVCADASNRWHVHKWFLGYVRLNRCHLPLVYIMSLYVGPKPWPNAPSKADMKMYHCNLTTWQIKTLPMALACLTHSSTITGFWFLLVCNHTAQSINIHGNHSPIQVSVGRSEKPTSRTRSLQRRKHYSIAQDSCGHVLSWYEVVCQIPKINARTIQL